MRHTGRNRRGGKAVSSQKSAVLRRKAGPGAPPKRPARPALWDRLELEKVGIVRLEGLRVVFLPASTLTDIEAAGERILGRGLGAILHEAGLRTGRDIALFALGTAGTASPEAILRFMESGHADRGYGEVSFPSSDLANGSLVARVNDSPYAESGGPRRSTACYFPLGFWVGFVGSMSGKTVTGAETQCRAKGAAFCEFSILPTPPSS